MKIDGRKIAEGILEELKKRVENLKEKNIIPHLVVILIGNDPVSSSYVNQKKINAEKIGAKISIHQFSYSVTGKFVLGLLNDLNHLTSVHGIIVQRPLPKAIDKNKISLGIDPKKDVDGFHPASYFQPPLALAVLRILRSLLAQGDSFIKRLKDKKIVIIGKGETGGKPIIDTFRKMGIDPKITDSKTPNPQSLTKKADIIISCVGKPNVIKPEMIKKGVILVGVGLYKGEDGKMHGDYDEEEIKNKASFYTPTPGGVGPVNVAMLLKNLVKAAENLR